MSKPLSRRQRRRLLIGLKNPTAERSKISAPYRRPDRARSRKTRARRIDRYGQAAFTRARSGYSSRREQFPLFRNGNPAHGIRSAYHRQCRVQLHAAAAAWHRRINIAVEPAALSVELENRAGHCSRQHRYRQAERAHANDGLHPLRDRARSRFAKWRP